MMTYRPYMGILVVLAASLTWGRSVFAQEVKAAGKDVGPKEVLVNRPPVALVPSPALRPNGTVIAGMFEGTFSVGRTRVVAGKNATALVLASITPDGQARWMRSVDGLAKGRAVASIPAPEAGTLVVGVFKGKFDLALPKQPGFDSGDGDGLFLTIVTPAGRLTLGKMLALAGGFSTPTVQLQSGKFLVEVPYTGKVSKVPLKSLPPLKPGPAILRLGVSREGKLLSAESVKAPTGADTTTTGKPQVTPPVPGHPSTLALAPLAVCNVCIADVPRTDPACQSCRDSVCSQNSDLWCCTTGWDWQCMNEALTGTCATTSQMVCNCPHRTGDVGIWMYYQCKTPPPAGCVSNICTGDGYCTFNAWDNVCVAESTCGGQ